MKLSFSTIFQSTPANSKTPPSSPKSLASKVISLNPFHLSDSKESKGDDSAIYKSVCESLDKKVDKKSILLKFSVEHLVSAFKMCVSVVSDRLNTINASTGLN